MHRRAWALVAAAAAGCHPSPDTQPAPPAPATAVASTTAEPTADAPPPKLTLPGIFKPIPERSTDDLLIEVEAPGTRDRLPLLAELAKRTADRDRIRPVARKLMLDGRYAVRVAAAMVVVAVDAEHPHPAATDLVGAITNRTQMPVYGPLIEDTPELRQIRTLAVPGLVKAIEREMTEPKKEHTAAALTVLGTIPADIGTPAVDVVKRVAATAGHPNSVAARELLKKWGVE